MRAKNMQSLTDASKRRHPGVVIYGIGDEAHKLRTSDHNEDDTTGSKAAQSDPDSTKEHRAIDVMLGPSFTRAQARALIADILADPAARARLIYINFENTQWSKSNNWQPRDNSDDPHPGHIHLSGWAAADENAAGWPAVDGMGGNMFCNKGDNNENVRRLQRGLLRLEAGALVVDGDYGTKTSAVVKRLLGGTGDAFDSELSLRLEEKIAVRAVKLAGLVGTKGDPGKDGRDGVITPGARLVVESVVLPPVGTVVESVVQ